MLEALIKGKLSREQENMEDILTSCVFGLLKLIRPDIGLFQYLAMAKRASGGPDLLAPLADIANSKQSDVTYSFWPRLAHDSCHPCEPDLLIRIESKRLLVLIESKFQSGKSSDADNGDKPHDQLAREWDNLILEAARIEFQPVLVYLTADLFMPRTAVSESVEEFTKKRTSAPTPDIYWLSWQHLDELDRTQDSAIAELSALLNRLDLVPFRPFEDLLAIPPYSYREEAEFFIWNQVPNFTIAWAFNGDHQND